MARQRAEQAQADRLAAEAKALQAAHEAKARQLAERAESIRLRMEAEARQAAEEAKALQAANEAKARKLADEASARRLEEEARAGRLIEDASALRLAVAASIEQLLPPVVSILSPAHGEAVTTRTLAVKVRVHHPKDKPIDEVWATVDGRALSTRGVQIKEALTGSGTGRLVSLEVAMPDRDCIVSVMARSGQAVSEAASVTLKWGGTAKTQAKGSLKLLAVGVSSYRDAGLNLNFAAKDARDLDGQADLFRKGRVTVSSLDAFLGDRVPTLTQGQQVPTVIRPAAVPDFAVALVP